MTARPTGRLGAIGAIPRALRYTVIVCVSLGAVGLYLLSVATANTTLFARHYPTLLAVNGALVLGLVTLVVYQLALLGRGLRRKVFGSRLALRFVLLFALMALLPGALIYAVSVQFLARSIESWFEVRVDKALEGGLNLGRGVLDNMLRDLGKKSEIMADAVSRQTPVETVASLNSLREQSGVQEVALIGPRGRVLAYAGTERSLLLPEGPPPAVLRQVRAHGRYGAVESLPDGGLQLRVVVPVPGPSLGDEERILQLVQPVPGQISADAETVQAGYRDYQELVLARVGLKRLHGVTLTLALLVALLSAFLLAFFLSERLAAPLATLARGTRAVAQGDFSQRIPVESHDELGVLTESFNTMTAQLAEARSSAERNQAELATAKAYVDSLLANLSAGVMSFDSRFRLRATNPGAAQILAAALTEFAGEPLAEVGRREPRLAPVAETILAAFAASDEAEWEKQLLLADGGREKVLLLRGTRFASGSEAGYVVVFDDITEVVQAQRHAAWSEVARRLAHEIRNPLTPIQLSAERMQLKLADRLPPAEADMLARSTRTIVEQVAALKSMVDAFSQYARSPEPKLAPLDLNQLAREVLGLYETLGKRMKLELAPDLPTVRGDARLLRQVIHNLMQNAQDALADVAEPRIVVVTQDTGRMVRLSIEDNGAGFPEALMQRAFEPYVTTKQKGTGLGLSIVKKIVEDHGGTVSIANVRPHGARVSLDFPYRNETGARAPVQAVG